MKKLPILIISLIFGIFFSCSNDIELTTEWKDIPIVYGIISMNDTAHYIRVQKAFLDPETDAFVLAQNPDSIYYQNLSVQLEKVSTGAIYDLQKVNGNEEGYIKEPGDFVNDPNYLYKLIADDIDIEGGELIRLNIIRNDKLPNVIAETYVVEDIIRQNSVPGNVISFNYFSKTKFAWRPGLNAKIFDAFLILHYDEYDVNTPDDKIAKTIKLPINRNILSTGAPQVVIEYDGIGFYLYLKDNMIEDQNTFREMKTVDYHVVGGGNAMAKLSEIFNANTGITSSQDLPSYSNLSEGLGIFSSTNELIVEDLSLSIATLDSLKAGIYTKNLNFQ